MSWAWKQFLQVMENFQNNNGLMLSKLNDVHAGSIVGVITWS